MNVSVLVAELYDAVPATVVPALVASVNVTVPDCTASLNVAVGAADTATPVAPDAGV